MIKHKLLLISSFPLLFVCLKDKVAVVAKAANTTYEGSKLPTTINLNDYTENEVRGYYSNLNSLDETKRKGDELLKFLKPILSNNQKYYNYDSGDIVWRMYEITDRDWSKSPASDLGSIYDAATNTITGYTYKTSDPYLKSYYMDYTKENVVTAWADHTQNGVGINREHLWAKAEGFDEDSGAGSRGDPMHLVAANGYANNIHNNNFYGFVDKNKEYKDTHDKYDTVGHNYLGSSKTFPTSSVTVFEPQDSDKGDIARAIFYMAARYNDIAGDDETIGGANPNLRLTDDLSLWQKNGYTSSKSNPGYMGCLSDLLEWNKLDPVDEYEIHRNNLLCRNFTNNRNPFIDFPQWADAIWGKEEERVAVNPQEDELNKGSEYIPPTPTPTPTPTPEPDPTPLKPMWGCMGSIETSTFMFVVPLVLGFSLLKVRKNKKRVN